MNICRTNDSRVKREARKGVEKRTGPGNERENEPLITTSAKPGLIERVRDMMRGRTTPKPIGGQNICKGKNCKICKQGNCDLFGKARKKRGLFGLGDIIGDIVSDDNDYNNMESESSQESSLNSETESKNVNIHTNGNGNGNNRNNNYDNSNGKTLLNQKEKRSVFDNAFFSDHIHSPKCASEANTAVKSHNVQLVSQVHTNGNENGNRRDNRGRRSPAWSLNPYNWFGKGEEEKTDISSNDNKQQVSQVIHITIFTGAKNDSGIFNATTEDGVESTGSRIRRSAIDFINVLLENIYGSEFRREKRMAGKGDQYRGSGTWDQEPRKRDQAVNGNNRQNERNHYRQMVKDIEANKQMVNQKKENQKTRVVDGKKYESIPTNIKIPN